MTEEKALVLLTD